jgi:hypothetical protein
VPLGFVDRRWFAAREHWSKPELDRCDELSETLASLGVTELEANERSVGAYGRDDTGVRWLGRESLRGTDTFPLLGALDRLGAKIAERAKP